MTERQPRIGWADILTKQDLAGFEQRMERRFDRLGPRPECLHVPSERLGMTAHAAISDVGAPFERGLRTCAITVERALRDQLTRWMFALVSIVMIMSVLAFALAYSR